MIVGVFALAGAQFPKITQDYQRQFAVRCSEINAQMQKIKLRAENLNETPIEYIRKHFLANSDVEVAYQGQSMQQTLERYQVMSLQLTKAQSQKQWLQPIYWFFHQDLSISLDIWKTYEVGFIYTFPTLIWALAGGASGWLVLSLFFLIAKSLLRAIKSGVKALGAKTSVASKEDEKDFEKISESATDLTHND